MLENKFSSAFVIINAKVILTLVLHLITAIANIYDAIRRVELSDGLTSQ